ncbi:vacuolar protein sorting-associated protein 33B-like [Oratosquilla oratoria]|uniref:vacuolar protein sorting-associated protein 33B-like n=1 Tax=Oratosquilla oratoria TaxID=337810 RepID=UPI003F75C652
MSGGGSRSLGLDVEVLRQLSRDHLIRLLEEAPGSKDLILDVDLMKLLDRIADAQILRNHGVDKIYRLERLPPPVLNVQRIYILRPTLVNVKYMADHMHSHRAANEQLGVHLVVVPRIQSWVTLLLEEEGLHGLIHIHEFTPEFIPLDDDLLSLEMHSFFRDAFLDGDFSLCCSVAQALYNLQGLYGRIPNVFAHGRAAQGVLAALDSFSDREPSRDTQVCEIGHLFIFDRDLDYVTPLLTQLTYEGAIDEHFGIKAGVVEFPKEVAGKDTATKVSLNSRDTIYDNIRNRHMAGVSNYLITRAREVHAKKDKAQGMSVAQMKTFVANELKTIQNLQQTLTLYLRACEAITSRCGKDLDAQLRTEYEFVTGSAGAKARTFIEDCLARQLPVSNNLRLIGLYSYTQEGLSRKDYETVVAQLVAAYGHEQLVTIHNLRSLGILTLASDATAAAASSGSSPSSSATLNSFSSSAIVSTSSGKGSVAQEKLKQVTQRVASALPRRASAWRALANKLQLIPDEDEPFDLHNPTHMSYVFNGVYTPAIPKVIASVLERGPASVSDALKLAPGSTTSYCNPSAVGVGTFSVPRVVLVVFLGGVAWSEVAALRLLGVITSTRFIIATTATINGNTLLQEAIFS